MKNGFSVIEVLVAIGIMGVASLGLMELMNNNYKQISRASAKLETVDLQNTVRTILSDSNICELNLTNQTIDLSSPAESYSLDALKSYDSDGKELETIAAKDTKLSSSSQVTVTDITLNNVKKISSNEGYMKLNVGVKVNVSGTEIELKPLTYSALLFKTDSSNKVTYCSLAPTLTNQLTQLLATIKPFTTKVCKNSQNSTKNTITATCGDGYKLLNCFGAPGDQTESDEGWLVEPDYDTNTCTLTFQNVACGDTSNSNSLQQQVITAYCFLESEE